MRKTKISLFRCEGCKEEFLVPSRSNSLILNRYRVKYCPCCGNLSQNRFCSNCNKHLKRVVAKSFRWCPYCGAAVSLITTF